MKVSDPAMIVALIPHHRSSFASFAFFLFRSLFSSQYGDSRLHFSATGSFAPLHFVAIALLFLSTAGVSFVLVSIFSVLVFLEL